MKNKITVRCADGPYAGQTFLISRSALLRVHWTYEVYPQPVGPLMWINYGTDRHCYQLTSNGHYAGWRLVYRDTF